MKQQAKHLSPYGSVTAPSATAPTFYSPPQQIGTRVSTLIGHTPSHAAPYAPHPGQTQNILYSSSDYHLYPINHVIGHGLLPATGTSYILAGSNIPHPTNPNQVIRHDQLTANVITQSNGTTSRNSTVIHQPNPNQFPHQLNSINISNPVNYVLTPHEVGGAPPPFAGPVSAQPSINQVVQQQLYHKSLGYPSTNQVGHTSPSASRISVTNQSSQILTFANPMNAIKPNFSHDVNASADGASNIVTQHLPMSSNPTNSNTINMVTL